jgi:hypothetical protein
MGGPYSLGAGDRWFESLGDLDEFTAFVTSHPAMTAVESCSDGAAEIWYEQSG